MIKKMEIIKADEGNGFIYGLIRNGKMVYIGQSSRKVLVRPMDHFDNKDFDEVVYYQHPLRSLDREESVMIARHMPEYNKQITSCLKIDSKGIGTKMKRNIILVTPRLLRRYAKLTKYSSKLISSSPSGHYVPYSMLDDLCKEAYEYFKENYAQIGHNSDGLMCSACMKKEACR